MIDSVTKYTHSITLNAELIFTAFRNNNILPCSINENKKVPVRAIANKRVVNVFT